MRSWLKNLAVIVVISILITGVASARLIREEEKSVEPGFELEITPDFDARIESAAEDDSAIQTVEMDQQPTGFSATEAPVCDTGSAVDLYFDDMEDIETSGNWGVTVLYGTAYVWYYTTVSPINGSYSLYGYDRGSKRDEAIYMTSDVTLPASGTAYLRFIHKYGFEYSQYLGAWTAWDGGVLEYSTNGGTTWTDTASLFPDNGYTGTIYSSTGTGNNTLGGRQAFVSDSNGVISSRLDLSSLAGNNVRFRFRIGTDLEVGDDGWWVDDVRIYTCSVADTTPPTVTISSPTNTTYSSTNISLAVSANETVATWKYSLNGAANVTFTPNTTITAAEGSNNIIVYATDSAGNTGSATVYFTVSLVPDTTPPTVTISSPTNTTYSSTNISLAVSANETVATWKYSLNGAGNVTFTPNTTITAAEGSNNIIVYATDSAGNTGSATVYFTVQLPGSPASVVVTASPSSIEADGTTASTITTTVTDENGTNVADGTTVSFSTNLGSLSASSNTTTSGIATVTITSTTTGTATVNATADSITNSTTVEFTVAVGDPPSVIHQYHWYADYDSSGTITRADGLVIGVIVNDTDGLSDISSVTVDATALGMSSTLTLNKNPGGAWSDGHYLEALDLAALNAAASSSTSAASPEDKHQSPVEKLESAGGIRIKNHQFTGMVRFMSTQPGKLVKTSAALSWDGSPETAARSFLDEYGPAFGIRDQSEELSVMKTRSIADQGRSFVRFQQQYNGVPVMGGELIVQVKDNNIVSVNGEAVPDIVLDTDPVIGADEARETALQAVSKWYDEDESALRASDPELWIYNPVLLGIDMDQDYLVWRMDVESTNLKPIRELVGVDAQSGLIVLHFNQIETAKNRFVYNNNNDPSAGLPGTGPVRTEGQAATGINEVDYAYDYAGDTYDYYYTTHGRDGINGSGMDMIFTVRYCYPTSYGETCPLTNAFWNGEQMVFGDGYASADDVVGHELTHGVTDYESNLYYYMQSGALSEHLSDAWGEFVDLSNVGGTDTSSVRWLMGEDLSGGAIRSMSNPTLYSDPDKMTSSYYACGTSDNGGVHTNSGVGNKLVYLLVDGGSFNGQTVTIIGMTKTAKIYYEAATNMLTSGSDYADLATGLSQACQSLIGTASITSSDCQQVDSAIQAVEMDQQPTSCAATDANVCDTGSAVNLFFDDMEDTGSGKWTYNLLTGSGLPDLWYYDFDRYTASGVYALKGWDYAATSGAAMKMTNTVSIPSGAYMHFKQAYDFEIYSSSYYDGGVLEYSTDGGTTWTDTASLFTDNGYTGTIKSGTTNPLAGREGFGGYSSGYISSRLDLSTLAGNNVRFRFRIGSDSSTGGRGWWVDDVRVYTCSVGDTTPPTTTIASPQNTTYTSSSVDLDYSVSETTSWVGYSLDGAANVTLTGNTTLSSLSDGQHYVTVWATDTAGNIGSTTVWFSVSISVTTFQLPVTVTDSSGLTGTGNLSVTIKKDIVPEIIHSVSWSDASGNTLFVAYPWDIGTSHISSVKLDASTVGLWDDLAMSYDSGWGGYALWTPITAGTFSSTASGSYSLNIDVTDTSGYSGTGTVVFTKS